MVKEKPNSVRTYDAEGFRRRASCLCFRDKTEQEILGNINILPLVEGVMVDYHTREKISHSGKRIFQSLIFFPECGHLPSHPQLKAILLVTSSKDREKFVVPGGGIEPQEDPKLTAEREALEEAGVRGDLGRYLGTFENEEKMHRTLVFAFIVTEFLDDWDDKRVMGRSRQWFTIEEAKKRLSHKPLQVTYLQLLDKPERIS